MDLYTEPTLSCLAEAPGLPLHLARPGSLPALLNRLGEGAAGFLTATGFAAKPGELALLAGGSGLAGAVLGLGDGVASAWSFGRLPTALPAGSSWALAPSAEAEDPALAAAATLGWCLGAYRFSRFKPVERPPARLVMPPGGEWAAAVAAATWRVRDLINSPANLLGPAELAGEVAALAERHGARCEIVTGAALAQDFPAVAAVGGGAGLDGPRGPRVALLEWQGPGAGPDAPLVALCGKGVCFDTGGLDLKPSAAMLRMKKDMGGAAVMMGVAELAMRAALPIRLLLLVGAVENAVSANAFRPMDVIATRAGLSVEVGNTDAEGRLVLADLLTCAAERRPALVLDAATLTGAARVALGPDLPALFTPDDALATTMLAAGLAAEDPLWRLPLHQGYAPWLESGIADLNNVGSKPMAGAIVAALFMQRFMPPGIRWAHLDVYAWNDSDRPGRPEGGEAQALRAGIATLAKLFGASSVTDCSGINNDSITTSRSDTNPRKQPIC